MTTLTRTQLAICLHSVPHLGPKGIQRIIGELPECSADDVVNLADLRAWNLSADTLQREYKIHPDAARLLTEGRDEVIAAGLKIADAAERLGISTMTSLDPDYPASLKEYTNEPPPIIYAHGNLGLLRERRFAVVSSSGVSAQNLETIREFSGTLADEGLVTLTSHNTPAYQISGVAAKSRQRPVILVLDRGILSAFPHGLGYEPIPQARIWDLHFDPTRDLVLSRFRLYDRWIGANGRERDQMVFALADVLIAVEVRPDGVMQSECIRAHKIGREVYVYAAEENPAGGNVLLLDAGCPSIPHPTAKSLLATLDLFHEPADALFEDEVGRE